MEPLKRFKRDSAVLISDSLFARLYVSQLNSFPSTIAKQLMPPGLCLYDYMEDGSLVMFTRLFAVKLMENRLEVKWLITAADSGKTRLVGLHHDLVSINRAIDQLMIDARDREPMPTLKACGISSLLGLSDNLTDLSKVMNHQNFPIPIPKPKMILGWRAVDFAKWVDLHYHIYMKEKKPDVDVGLVFDSIDWKQPKRFLKRR